jgi:hypothetical protein
MDILDCVKNSLSGKVAEDVLNEAIMVARQEFGGRVNYIRTDKSAYIRQMLRDGADQRVVMKRYGLRSQTAISYHLKSMMR